MSVTLFISDLHLDSSRPEILNLFRSFLESIDPPSCDALYILGDLFEAWVGDDQTDPFSQDALAALRKSAARGVPLFFMHGNRDFLAGNGFADATGCRLIDDPVVVPVQGTGTVLTHGDGLCTADIEYQEFRKTVRGDAWQQDFLSRPLAERLSVAADMRDASRAQTRDKPVEITDVSDAAVSGLLRQYGVRRMIHGHTHRPAIHDIALDGATAKRYVLGDWYTGGSVLRCNPDRWWLERFEP